MEAIILAAGGGSRLGQGCPKCLCEVGGRPLIEHQLDALHDVGVTSVVVVIGFQHEQVKEVVGDRARYVVNERYADSNSLFSFALAAAAVNGPAFVLNADVLFDPPMLESLMGAGPNAVAFDSGSGADPEHMKLAIEDGCLLEMGKGLSESQCSGENVGVFRLGREALSDAFATAEHLVRHHGGGRDWVASAINKVARRHRVQCVDVAGTPWVEIDYPIDLEHARRRTWPAIAATCAPGQVAVGARQP